MALKEVKNDQIFASVLADGKIHVTVPEGTEGAVVREYETSTGEKGSKTEKIYTQLVGKITKVNFYEGDYGRQLQLTVDDGKEKPVVLSLSTSSSYGEDMMKKLLSIDITRTVKIVPYSFEDDNKKKKKGITIWQKADGAEKPNKVGNYFYDEETKATLHGFPEPKKGKKPLSKDQWKLYFGEVREFLVEKITEHFKLEEVAKTPSMNDDDFDNF
ncbi:MAG TPA: hypothetical protein V6D19_13060 [Stenomitos sp.]